MAAIVNAVGIIKVCSAAEDAEHHLRAANRHYRSVASFSPDIHRFCSRYDLRRVSRASLAGFKKDKLDWVAKLDHGVWIIRLLRTDKVDHCVVVDGARKLIYDGAEEYAIDLSLDALIHCGGGAADKLVIAEARQVHPVVGRNGPAVQDSTN